MKVGVLALQGAFGLHERVLGRLGATVAEVRTPEDLTEVDRLVVPGGESTAISKLLDSNDLAEPLAERLVGGLPVLGTCAGMILLSSEVVDGYPGQRCYAAVDLVVRRNGYGRQSESFSAPLTIAGSDRPFTGVFIRAPVVESVGAGVEVLATLDETPVLCRQGPVMVSSFHPELADNDQVHRWFLELN